MKNRYTRPHQSFTRAFTIVELLIVVVVIAILAAITIVAYNGIRDRAVSSQVQSALSQANKKVLAYAALNGDQYPATLADAGVTDGSAAYQYTSDNSTQPARYAVTASNGIAGTTSFYISSTKQQPRAGIAPGHNTLAWDEPSSATAPVNLDGTAVIDTAQYRNGSASVRLAPGAIGKRLRIDPTSGAAGQTVTISLWVKSESTWNGTTNNSKIRIGSGGVGALLKACVYNGAKLVWTEVTCDYLFTPDMTSINVSVGNDGSVGNIWIDDVSVAIE